MAEVCRSDSGRCEVHSLHKHIEQRRGYINTNRASSSGDRVKTSRRTDFASGLAVLCAGGDRCNQTMRSLRRGRQCVRLGPTSPVTAQTCTAVVYQSVDKKTRRVQQAIKGMACVNARTLFLVVRD